MTHHLRSTPLSRPGLGRALAALLLTALPSAGLGGCGGSGSGSSGGGSFGGAGLRVYVETGPDNARGVYVARYDGGAVPLHRGPMTFSLARGSVRDAFSADGEWALYAGNDGDEHTADVVVVRLADGARRVLDSYALPVTPDTAELLGLINGVWSPVGHHVVVNHLLNPEPNATSTVRLYEALTGDYNAIFGDQPGSGNASFALWQPGGAFAQLLWRTGGTFKQYVAYPSGFSDSISPPGTFTFVGLSLSWSPDGQRTGAVTEDAGVLSAFASPVGTAPTVPFLVLPAGATFAGEPRWSPDSTRVVYCADAAAPGKNEVYVLPASGGLLKKVGAAGPSDTINGNGQWAAGGGRVVFARTHAITGAGLFSTNVTTLVATPIAEAGPLRVFRQWSVSPAGDRVAYVTVVSPDFTDARMFVVDADGANEVEVDLQAPFVEQASFQWSPSGAHLQISATVDPQGEDQRVFLVDADGVSVAPALPAGYVKNFVWSEDGSHFAYVVEEPATGADVLYVGAPGTATLSRPLDGTGVTTVRGVQLR